MLVSLQQQLGKTQIGIKQAFSGMPTLRITAEVVLSGRQAMSILTSLTLRHPLIARRNLKLLQTLKEQKEKTKTYELRNGLKLHKYSHTSTKTQFKFALQ